MQLAASIIYFYVFGLGAIILTYIIARFGYDLTVEWRRTQRKNQDKEKEIP